MELHSIFDVLLHVVELQVGCLVIRINVFDGGLEELGANGAMDRCYWIYDGGLEKLLVVCVLGGEVDGEGEGGVFMALLVDDIA